jgi:hypothetical protein
MVAKVRSRFDNSDKPNEGDLIWTGYESGNGWETNHRNSKDQTNIVLPNTGETPLEFYIIVQTDKRNDRGDTVWPPKITAKSDDTTIATVGPGGRPKDNCTMPHPPVVNITDRSKVNFTLKITVQPGLSLHKDPYATVTVGDEGTGDG